jgi:uncharacterized protein (DUF58 family)
MDSARWLEVGEPLASIKLGGRRGVLVLVLLALLAAWTEHQPAVFLLLGLLALLGLARVWADHALDGVVCAIEAVEDRAFCGDSIKIVLAAENSKLLPLTWLRARAAIPPSLTPSDLRSRWPYSETGGYVQGLTALPWRSGARWEIELPCRGRGVHQIGPVEITSGDPFGLFGRRAVLRVHRSLVIYPRVLPLRQLGFPEPVESGAALPRRAFQEDPARAAGVRAYRPGDAMRRIHWKATARQGELQVRVVDPAAAPTLLLVLLAETFDHPWTRYREDLFELAVSAVASIASRALADRWPVALLVSGAPAVRLPPASAPRQLTNLLEALARVKPQVASQVTDSIWPEALGARNATCVVTAGRTNDALRSALGQLRIARRPVVLLHGDEPPVSGPRLKAYRLRAWDDLARTLQGPGQWIGYR